MIVGFLFRVRTVICIVIGIKCMNIVGIMACLFVPVRRGSVPKRRIQR